MPTFENVTREFPQRKSAPKRAELSWWWRAPHPREKQLPLSFWKRPLRAEEERQRWFPWMTFTEAREVFISLRTAPWTMKRLRLSMWTISVNVSILLWMRADADFRDSALSQKRENIMWKRWRSRMILSSSKVSTLLIPW